MLVKIFLKNVFDPVAVVFLITMGQRKYTFMTNFPEGTLSFTPFLQR